MKKILTKLCWPVLSLFESGTEEYLYKPSYRLLVVTVGVLFIILSSISMYFAPAMDDKGFYIPVVVFFVVGLGCLIIGGLGSERAIGKIWGSKKPA